jgi:hypothetical protein
MATWPATLPPPEKPGYQIAPTDPAIRTEMEVGLPRTRRRSAARDDRITVSWKFTDAQMQTFRTFFNGDGQGGAALDEIDDETVSNILSFSFDTGDLSALNGGFNDIVYDLARMPNGDIIAVGLQLVNFKVARCVVG